MSQYQYCLNVTHTVFVNIYTLVGWLVVLYVPSTPRSFRDVTPHLLSLA